MFLGMNQNMVDGFDQNSNPSLDLLKKNNIVQWEGGPLRCPIFRQEAHWPKELLGFRHLCTAVCYIITILKKRFYSINATVIGNFVTIFPYLM